MTYSQLREEIRVSVRNYGHSLSSLEAMQECMTAIDTYLEEKAVEVENLTKPGSDIDEKSRTEDGRLYACRTKNHVMGFNSAIKKAALIIRSKE
jgi:hypothetical protein